MRPSFLHRVRAATSVLRTRSRSFVAPGLLRTPLVVLLLVVAFVACSDSSKPAANKVAPAKSTTTTTAPPPVAPLTGLPDPDGVAQGRPLVSIKIDNDNDDARPQTGLEIADVVWDEVVEGESTRFLAMFQSRSTDVVGPVRSVRLTDPLIVWPEGGIFAYSGGAKYAVDGISLAPVKRIDESAAGSAMFRDSSRRAPHNLYARPDELFALGGDPTPPPPLFEFAAPNAAPVGSPVASVRVGFSGTFAPTYTWDAGSSTWLRSTSDGPFMAKSGTQIAPNNVIVLPVVYAGGVGQIGAEAQMVGQGVVQVFTNGRMITGTWSRVDAQHRIEFKDGAGAPILLTPGQTWVELPSVSYAIDVTPAAPPAP